MADPIKMEHILKNSKTITKSGRISAFMNSIVGADFMHGKPTSDSTKTTRQFIKQSFNKFNTQTLHHTMLSNTVKYFEEFKKRNFLAS